MTRTAEECGFDLAVQLQQQLAGEDRPTMLCGCCWILAGLVLEAERDKGAVVEHSMALVIRQLIACVEQLRHATTVVH